MSRLFMTIGGGLIASISFVAWDMRTDAEMIREARLSTAATLPAEAAFGCPQVLSDSQLALSGATAASDCVPQHF